MGATICSWWTEGAINGANLGYSWVFIFYIFPMNNGEPVGVTWSFPTISNSLVKERWMKHMDVICWHTISQNVDGVKFKLYRWIYMTYFEILSKSIYMFSSQCQWNLGSFSKVMFSSFVSPLVGFWQFLNGLNYIIQRFMFFFPLKRHFFSLFFPTRTLL